MYTEEEFLELEEEELYLTNEAIMLLLATLYITRENLEEELRSFYSKYGKDGVVTYSEARKWVSERDHRRRLTALTAFVGLEFASTLDRMKGVLENMLEEVIGWETDFFKVEVNVDKLLTTPWGEDYLTWLQRLENDVELWTIKINADLKRSMLQRKSLEEVLKLLNKRFESIESVTTSLGLSESSAIGSIARQKIFQELGVGKYQFYTKPDERRCETCGAMHGLIFPISAYEVGVTASPLHPRCRCWEVPIWD